MTLQRHTPTTLTLTHVTTHRMRLTHNTNNTNRDTDEGDDQLLFPDDLRTRVRLASQ